jgi:hypothetical protein
MRVFVRADNYAQFLDWCALYRVNPRAARFIGPGDDCVPPVDATVVDLRVAALAPNLGSMQAVAAA